MNVSSLTGNDYYERSPCIRYTLIVWIAIWVCAFLASGVLITNAQFRVEICEPQGGPCTGTIRSDLFTSAAWIATSLFALNAFFIMAYFMIIAFGRNKVCAAIWMIVALLCWMGNMVSWVLLLGQYVNCNKPGHPGNICTSLEACLVPEFFNNALTRCPNSPLASREYTLQLNQLAPRADFLWLFGTVSAFTFVLNLAIVLVILVLWFGFSDSTRLRIPIEKKRNSMKTQ